MTRLPAPASRASLLALALVAGCGSSGGGAFYYKPDGGALPDGGGGMNNAAPDLAAGPGTCTDSRKNGQETDVDCGGGACPRCGEGRACLRGSDCTTDTCLNNTCAPPAASCFDGAKNGSESDTDCGGGTCPPCTSGKLCRNNNDCVTGNCANGICASPAPSCNDGAQNGRETDVDCGGGTCPKCANGLGCFANSDCTSGSCQAGVCGAPQKFNCNDAISCINACMDNACVTACYNMINTTNGKTRLQAVYACLETACPSKNGGVCDSMALNYDKTKCSTCFMNAQAMNGACYTALNTCHNDM